MKTDAEPVEIGSISREIYVSASDLAALLKISDNEVSRLSRSGVLAFVTCLVAYENRGEDAVVMATAIAASI